jgi:hypothetical protein
MGINRHSYFYFLPLTQFIAYYRSCFQFAQSGYPQKSFEEVWQGKVITLHVDLYWSCKHVCTCVCRHTASSSFSLYMALTQDNNLFFGLCRSHGRMLLTCILKLWNVHTFLHLIRLVFLEGYPISSLYEDHFWFFFLSSNSWVYFSQI